MILGRNPIHLCVDMQRIFSDGSPWETPWMKTVLPRVAKLAGLHPDRTIFTRFIPPEEPAQAPGAWAAYWEHWSSLTLNRLPPEALQLVEPLSALVPPGDVLDKGFYSPWFETDLEDRLRRRNVDCLVVSGAETDVCVLSAVLGAVDRGFRVCLAKDAVCSSSDETHDAILQLFHHRYGQHVSAATTEDIVAQWP